MDVRSFIKENPVGNIKITDAENLVDKFNARSFIDTINFLHELMPFTDETYSAFCELIQRYKLTYATPLFNLIKILQEKKILSEKIFMIICQFRCDINNIEIIKPILDIFEKEKMLSEDNFVLLQKAINFISRYKTNDFYKCVAVLHEAGHLKNHFSTLCKKTAHVFGLLTTLARLEKYKLFIEPYISIIIEHAEHAEDLLNGVSILIKANIRLSEDGSDNLQTYYQHIKHNPHLFKRLTYGLQILFDHKFLTDETFNILNQHPYLAEQLAIIINESKLTPYFYHLKSKTHNKKILGELLFFVWSMNDNQKKDVILQKTREEMYQYVIEENTNKFDEHIKIAAYFSLYHKMIHDGFNHEEIHESLSKLQPVSLRDRLKKIVNTLGAYSFMPDDEKNITLGVEIEYSNIPTQYKQLTESVMEMIQKKWSHPGDSSVDYIGINTYKGEATTPIIHHNTDLKATMLNVAFLQAMNAQTNQSCGLHVHIGIENIPTPPEYKRDDIPEIIIERGILKSLTAYQFKFIKQFILIYKREETQFASIERRIDDSESYAQIIKIPDNLHNMKDFDSLVNKINPNDRYHELNLRAYDKHGTLEIRRFSGTTEEPEIYATLSMIFAMAKEAQARTNLYFDLPLKQELTQNGTVEEKTTPPAMYQKAEEQDSLPLSFVTQQKTERERELFLLRVKSVNETQIKMIYDEEEKNQSFSNNTVYLYLTDDDKDLGYLFYNEKGFKKTGTIYYSDEDQYDKRFNSIIDKIQQRRSASITLEEKNQLLYEIAEQSGAHISHRIDKLKQIDCHSRLFSTYIENHKNKVRENNSNNAVDHTVKFHMSGMSGSS